MSSGNPTILVVEDDKPIRTGIVDALSGAGYDVLDAGDGQTGKDLALSANFDLLLLDLVLPHCDGFQILEAINQERPGLPVIILSARGEENDRIKGLKLGADDYVVKPFSVRELMARVEAVLRRSPERTQLAGSIHFSGGQADFSNSEIHFDDGETDQLSEREVDILRYLASHTSRAVSRDELLRRVWRIDPTNVETRTVDMHIAHLRTKLRDKEAKIVCTVHGKGYRLTLCEKR